MATGFISHEVQRWTDNSEESEWWLIELGEFLIGYDD